MTEYTPPGVAAVIVTFKVPVPVPPATTLTITLLKPVSVELFNTAIGPFVVTGEIKVAAMLPLSLTDPCVVVLDDRIIVAGGGTNGVWALKP